MEKGKSIKEDAGPGLTNIIPVIWTGYIMKAK
jgi:hypothetical protein